MGKLKTMARCNVSMKVKGKWLHAGETFDASCLSKREVQSHVDAGRITLEKVELDEACEKRGKKS